MVSGNTTVGIFLACINWNLKYERKTINHWRCKMKRGKLLALTTACAVILMFLFACNGKPDLVVDSLQVTGPPVLNATGSYEVDISVVVKNQGSSAAGAFKVSVEYTSPQGTFAVSFRVPAQPSIWYPSTTGLAEGSRVTFNGKLTFHPSVKNMTITIRAIADSCSGDEFMPNYCRVDESNEANNKSTAVTVVLP
jgi:hypothetical protein